MARRMTVKNVQYHEVSDLVPQLIGSDGKKDANDWKYNKKGYDGWKHDKKKDYDKGVEAEAGKLYLFCFGISSTIAHRLI